MIKLDIKKSLKGVDGNFELSLNLEISKGQFFTLYGDSGAGKTSTFRMLAGLLKPDSGSIIVDGATWFDAQKGINLSPQERNVGLVFQDYALFPNMTVQENLAFASNKKAGANILSELIDIFELGELKNRKPSTLSGGQQQRVALARAVAQLPKILLLDEPLAALDVQIRLKLQDYIQKIHQTYGLTTLLISHDLGEIFKLSDQVARIKHGAIVQTGNPDEIFINRELSGKFKFIGEVLKLEKQEIVYIVTVLIQSNIVKVIGVESEVKNLKIGDRVMVASKAFNPIIYKIN